MGWTHGLETPFFLAHCYRKGVQIEKWARLPPERSEVLSYPGNSLKKVSAACPGDVDSLVALVVPTNGWSKGSTNDERPNMSTTTIASEGRSVISEHPIVSPGQWIQHRKELLRKEKELTRLRDELNAERARCLG